MQYTCPDIGKKKEMRKNKKIEDVILHWIMNKVRFSCTGQLLRRLNVSVTICYYSLCGEHSRSKIIFLGKTYHRKVVILQIKGKP